MSLVNYEQFTKSNIGLKLLAYRNILDYTKSELAYLIGLSKTTIANVEKGQGVSILTIITYSYYSQISISEFTDCKESFSLNSNEIIEKFTNKINSENPEGFKEINLKRFTITKIILELVNSTYFKEKRSAKQIAVYLKDNHNIETTTSVISKMVAKLIENKKLKYTVVRSGYNLYHK